jgi:CHAT domain-containing protein
MTVLGGDLIGAVPWLRLADDHFPTLTKELAAGGAVPAQLRESLHRVRYEVVSLLEITYRELGHGSLAEWPGFVRDHEAAPAAEEGEEFGGFVSAFHALDAATRMLRLGRRDEAGTLIDAEMATLAARGAPGWLQEVITAKHDELVASGAGNMLAARDAIGRQLTWAKRAPGTLPVGVVAGATLDAMFYSMQAGREDLVFADAAKVLILANTLDSNPRGVAWRALCYLAEWAEACGRLWISCLFLKLAVGQLRDARGRLREAAPDLAVDPEEEEAQTLYGTLADTLVTLGRLAEATEAVELDLARGANESVPSWTDAEAKAVKLIQNALHDATGESNGSGGALAAALGQAATALARSGQARDDATMRLNATIRTRDIAALPDGTSPTTALLHYVVDRSSALVLVRIADRETIVPLRASGVAAINLVVFETLRAVADTTQDPRTELRRAYDMLLAPVVPCLHSVDRLLIAAPGALHGLPWGALYDGDRYAVEQWTWVRATAPGVNLRQHPAATIQMAVCAATRAGAGFSALGDTANREATAVSAGVSGGQLLDGTFTRVALQQALCSATVLHIASHFAPDPVRLDRSRLLLGDGTTVSLGELVGFGLSRMDLVVLSTCSSGVVDSVTSAEGAFAADSMLLAGGARAAVSTLWPTDSEATCALMAGFYQGLRAGLDKDDALAQGQRAFITGETGQGSWRLPFYWASAVLSGNWHGWSHTTSS